MGGCLWKNFYFIFFSQSLYCLAYSLIASHINSHSNTNTGLIANNNTNNAMHGLMNNIIINNNNNNIIILFSHYLIEQQAIEPCTTSVHLITLTSCLVQLHQAQHFFYGLYTTITWTGLAPVFLSSRRYLSLLSTSSVIICQLR